MGKMPKDMAEQEITGWLDHKKVDPSKREEQQDQIKILVGALVDGSLTLDTDNKVFKQNLKFPTDGDEPLTELTFKPRMAVATVHLHMQGVKSNDNDGRLLAYVCALTSKNKSVIKKLDTEDYGIASAIAVFFV